MTSFRLLQTGLQDAYTNMAVDEAILVCRRNTLRLYGWRPPAISIGHSQDWDGEIDIDACRRAGIDVVRRPTGGGALLHERELTYSFVCYNKILPQGLTDSYLLIAGAIIRGLRFLGVNAEVRNNFPLRVKRRDRFLCLGYSSASDIVVDGRKVAGSAQRRKGDMILQHGSVFIGLDNKKLLSVMRCKICPLSAISLEEVLGAPPGFSEVADCLRRGFEDEFSIKFLEGGLDSLEAEEVLRLRDKYKTPEGRRRARLEH